MAIQDQRAELRRRLTTATAFRERAVRDLMNASAEHAAALADVLALRETPEWHVTDNGTTRIPDLPEIMRRHSAGRDDDDMAGLVRAILGMSPELPPDPVRTAVFVEIGSAGVKGRTADQLVVKLQSRQLSGWTGASVRALLRDLVDQQALAVIVRSGWQYYLTPDAYAHAFTPDRVRAAVLYHLSFHLDQGASTTELIADLRAEGYDDDHQLVPTIRALCEGKVLEVLGAGHDRRYRIADVDTRLREHIRSLLIHHEGTYPASTLLTDVVGERTELAPAAAAALAALVDRGHIEQYSAPHGPVMCRITETGLPPAGRSA